MAEWFYMFSGEEAGPVSDAELKWLADQGTISDNSLVKKGKDSPWVSAGQVKGLFSPKPPPLPVASPVITFRPRLWKIVAMGLLAIVVVTVVVYFVLQLPWLGRVGEDAELLTREVTAARPQTEVPRAAPKAPAAPAPAQSKLAPVLNEPLSAKTLRIGFTGYCGWTITVVKVLDLHNMIAKVLSIPGQKPPDDLFVWVTNRDAAFWQPPPPPVAFASGADVDSAEGYATVVRAQQAASSPPEEMVLEGEYDVIANEEWSGGKIFRIEPKHR